ncbi:Dabb family protein [Parapedobacter indicus]|uniref:Tat (Twin-arginine translocation) pathway signal sequence n=1 Tax=Parapedobacter indicus TaxID=1477437 RepID=A0A1I3RZH3_9SPHI|nr:Dabb family protein [Parapedobacter indicus]PPK99953.1 secreted protein [Parapedobacter indicus]SFJ50666.1 Tat (twin-arginine translocation) pathway signal sequence [Parapedobacter indicus]
MERRRFIKQAGAAIAVAGAGGGLLAACASPTSNQENDQTSENPETNTTMENNEVIAHYVLFWLNDGLSEQEINDFANFFEELKTIPEIKSLHYGRAAATHARDVVDNSFTYNLLVFFDSLDEINVYETHPTHLAAIEKYSKFWNKVVVHDSVVKQAVV